jgi:hypothetical protein
MRTHSERTPDAVQRQCYVAMLSVSVSQDAYQGWGSLVDTYLPSALGVFPFNGAELRKLVSV